MHVLAVPFFLMPPGWRLHKHGPCKTVEGILISKILLPWQRVKLEYSFPVILRQITCLEFHETQHTYQY